jgi:DNA-binding NarL/FixJ family response regulator
MGHASRFALFTTASQARQRSTGCDPFSFSALRRCRRSSSLINLAFFEGLSQREIAARKSIALGTVKTRLQLAQKKLFSQLAPVQAMI